MKAILFTGAHQVEVTDLPDPKPGPSEVVLAVKASGICHTDFEVLKDNYGTGAFPVIPGHEYAGVVAEVGESVTDVAVGDRVVVDPNLECGTCRSCQRGWAHLCETLGAYGVTTHGGFAEKSVVKASAVHNIGEMSFTQAALAEPMGCVLNGVDAVHETWMEDALVIGAGPMGLLFAIALKELGVKNVVLSDILDSRLELASSFGFDVISSQSSGMERWHHRADLASPFEVFRRQLTLAGSHSLNHNIPRALKVIEAYGSDIARVVSHELSLDEVGGILSSHPPEGSLKVHAVWA